MHGQVARESDQLAEQEKRTRAEFTKAAEDFGRKFLPVAKDVLVWASNALDAFNKLPEGTQTAGLALLAFVAASGPVGAAITGIRSLIAAAVAARAALAALGSTPGAGGGRGGGGVGGIAGRGVLGTAALGAGLLVGTGSFAPAPYRGDDLQRQLEQAVKNRDQAQALANDTFLKSSRVVQQQRQGLAAANQRVAALQQQIQARDAAAAKAEQDKALGEADAASRAALSQLGDFGLSDAQRRPGAPGGGSGRSGAAAAERQAERRAALAQELAIVQARAAGDEASIKAAEERQTLAQLTADYLDAGYADANARALEHLSLLNQAEALIQERAKAEEDVDKILEGRQRQLEREADYQRLLNDQLLDALQIEAQLAGLRGEEGAIRDAERRLYVEQRTNELMALRLSMTEQEARAKAGQEFDALDAADRSGRMRDEFRTAFSDGIRAAIDGDVGGFFEGLADRFTNRMLDNLADDLFDLISNVGGDKKGGLLNTIASGIGSFFSGGARATGGPVTAGRAYKVNHNNPQSEWFVPGMNGSILTNGQMRGLQTGVGRGGGGAIAITVDVSGANGDAAVAAIAEAAARRGAEQAVAQSRLDQSQANAARRYRLK
jgi:hypothetical protein